MVFGPTVYDVPLLPYEKQLIETIGITEEEYQLFAAEVRRRGHVRPAEYDHIPDIQNAVGIGAGAYLAATGSGALLGGGAGKTAAAVILTNVAVGLTLTGIAYLLTPKPKEQAAFGRKELDSTSGTSRYTPSRGFDTLAELGEYASPIPLVFGLYREGYGGGMLSTPKLIWSRMFSHGTVSYTHLTLPTKA